jgi:dTDP-4-amino-4,6-dideoxygalactose transaminase
MKSKLESKFKQAKANIELQLSNLPPKSEILDNTFGKEIRPRKSLDISSDHLAYALKECALSRETERLQIEKSLTTEFYRKCSPNTPQHGLLYGLCVRTIYEASLLALKLPKESIVLMSGVTIQDMVVITEAHGIKVLAVDLDLKSLIPTEEELERLCIKFGSRVKVFVLAHLFGARTDVSKLLEVCKRYGVFFVEDCAEAWVSSWLQRIE